MLCTFRKVVPSPFQKSFLDSYFTDAKLTKEKWTKLIILRIRDSYTYINIYKL